MENMDFMFLCPQADSPACPEYYQGTRNGRTAERSVPCGFGPMPACPEYSQGTRFFGCLLNGDEKALELKPAWFGGNLCAPNGVLNIQIIQR